MSDKLSKVININYKRKVEMLIYELINIFGIQKVYKMFNKENKKCNSFSKKEFNKIFNHHIINTIFDDYELYNLLLHEEIKEIFNKEELNYIFNKYISEKENVNDIIDEDIDEEEQYKIKFKENISEDQLYCMVARDTKPYDKDIIKKMIDGKSIDDLSNEHNKDEKSSINMKKLILNILTKKSYKRGNK